MCASSRQVILWYVSMPEFALIDKTLCGPGVSIAGSLDTPNTPSTLGGECD
jgi:hypothetical protein